MNQSASSLSSYADSARVGVSRIHASALTGSFQEDHVAEETPIALEYNGISYATMLATPTDLEDFALGFSLTEGIINRPSDVRGIELRPERNGIVVELEISSACAMHLRERRRAMAGRTGCGLCGVESLPEVLREIPPVTATAALSARIALHAMSMMRTRQSLHRLTGATHAAGWAGFDGHLEFVREDVGRHNALDKLVGALVRSDRDAATGMVLVSSRASFEMVHKAASAGAGLLAAVSAPTALAIRTAKQVNLTLLGFMRQDDAVIYSHPERIIS
ncbi:formate dehydrogenase accessory sulfurtransferase FdhD [Alcaligenes sp. DN25]|uniref:formate dehydrogenase accessory sulfurtransferase FdhD n=1 Tax=Alcaligenes TaxID=507 RepID=UPI0020303E42|nr:MULTISPECIES: formate dehydrogenase accessory sulfurtransferase FdhD [Alcaligenes]URW83125.1 formate dehydrogenase accessory sulfurtransferase FdhD [Alcaligenes sp. DN25]WEA67956.1 formate dehydrogenase accessory sulfurtransferase FdhD [Alcaligenes faecalis]